MISPTQTEIRFVADDALMEKLQKIRELDAHVHSDPSYLELFHRLADLALKKLDPEQKKARVSTPPAESKEVVSSTVSVAVKREVWKRDRGCCVFQASDGKRCGSRFALQVDHIVPVALGGRSALDNLRLLCRNHNRQQAVAKLGEQTMRSYLRI